jgi:hypothetical protein
VSRSPDRLLKLFAQKTVVDLPSIQEALGGVSPMTAFRYLLQVPYRRSYNHNGGYYCLHQPAQYDRMGLWSVGDIHFSVDGSLKGTVRRLVHEAPAGATQRELAEWLRVRVHNTLLGLVRAGAVRREEVEAVYVYVHSEQAMGEEQLARRREQVEARGAGTESGEDPLLDDALVIQVLLTLIRHPDSGPADVARRLRGHVPPIAAPQVEAVFAGYGLGKKKGFSKR